MFRNISIVISSLCNNSQWLLSHLGNKFCLFWIYCTLANKNVINNALLPAYLWAYLWSPLKLMTGRNKLSLIQKRKPLLTSLYLQHDMFPDEICHRFVLCFPTITANHTIISLFIDQIINQTFCDSTEIWH